jgi:DNA processing protein
MNKLQPSHLPTSEKLNWLRLIRSKNLGPITFFKLLDRFSSATAALVAVPDLAIRGHAHFLSKRAIAVVGTRNASLTFRNFARKISHDLDAGGFLIISVMARGIGTTAHEGALDSGPVAVLGGGVGVVSPKENGKLYDNPVQSGVVVSEMPPGTKPIARHFPQRNRINSVISRGRRRRCSLPSVRLGEISGGTRT